MKQYEKLGEYVEAIKKYNPGSRAMVKTEGDDQFLRIYICLDACRKGFLEGCRPFIRLNACHLKVFQQGQLFAVVSVDGNDNIFPIAYAVCEIENKETWKWFLEELTMDIGVANAKNITFMSDQQKGLDKALEEEIPNVDHKFCVRHLHNNYKKSYKGDVLKKLMWEAAKASTQSKFENKMDELSQICPEVAQWLRKIPEKKWSRHAFREQVRCAMLLNNICESFNSFIKETRDKSILVMLEMIRRKLMDRFNIKRQGMLTYKHVVCPRILKVIEKLRAYEKEYITRLCEDGEFEVKHIHGEVNVVKLRVMECTCKRWQLSGIPCKHACAAIVANKQKPENFVYNCFSKSTFLACYKYTIHGIPSNEYWLKTSVGPIKPPKRKRQAGRPKRSRTKEEGEKQNHDPTKWERKGTSRRCGRCRVWKHNIRTCKGQPKPKKKNKRAGENIRVIDLGDERKQDIRIDNDGPFCSEAQGRSSTSSKGLTRQPSSASKTGKRKQQRGPDNIACLQTTNMSQPQHSQESISYHFDHQGPATMPSGGAYWSGNPDPNHI